jgi:uncharacterized membrane protein YraQ (UPF0718 family)
VPRAAVRDTGPLLPEWAVIAGLVAAVLVSLEVGYRLSRQAGAPSVTEALSMTAIGLSTLLLAFTYSLSQARFDERRLLVVKEANAIGTLYLRAGFLPAPGRDDMRRTLRRYLDVHVESATAGDAGRMEALIQENGRLQERLWEILQAQVDTLNPAVLLLTTDSLNAVIDVSAERVAEWKTRIPAAVLLLLIVAILINGLLVGYRPSANRRSLIHWGMYTVLMVMVMGILLDMNRPSTGFIRTSVQPLIELQESLAPGQSP